MRGPAALAVAVAVAVALALELPHAHAQPAEEPRAADLHEQVFRLTVGARDLAGREAQRDIAVTVYRPAGDGPFPVAIVSHGRAAQKRRAEQGRLRFETLARYLVGKGFAVFVPMRIGYGDTYGDFDPENTGGCRAMRPEVMAAAAADQVLATWQFARRQPYVDGARWVAMGVSVGGLATLAVASRNPPGLAAAINFAGGAGGNPEDHPGEPCNPAAIERLWRQQAATATAPTLWLYWMNDLYWGATAPRRWAEAWGQGGGRLEFHPLPPWPADLPQDGHLGLSRDMDGWVPRVEDFLARAGFTRSGLVPRPPASGFARLSDLDRVPVSEATRAVLYRRFLESPAPRAFAVGPGGQAGWARGDWAAGRALGFCQARSGQACRLYAVDGDVVWTP